MRACFLKTLFLCLLPLTLMMPSAAWSWSRYGHEVTGHLAMLDLTPAAREGVRALLGDEDLAAISAWADQVRPERAETAPFHYANGPLDVLVPTEADLALPKGNVYSAVLGYAGRIADERLSTAERAEALKFFVHFAGDLHQPLHAGFAEDRGGNDFPVLYRGELINLHRYWDNQILDPLQERYDSRSFAALLHARHVERERAGWTDVGNPRDWVVESRRLIFNGLYPRPRSDVATDQNAAIGVLDQSYRTVWQPLAELQLAKAGARIAWALNQIFETGASPFAEAPIPFPPPAG